MNIGEIMKSARLVKGFTLRQVENEIKISNGYLSQLENDKIKSPSAKTINSLCILYEISVDKMFNRESKKDESKWNEINKYLHLLTEEESREALNYIKYLIIKR